MNSEEPSRVLEQPSTSNHENTESIEEINSLETGYEVVAERKYPLKHIWTLWYFAYDRNLSWEEMQTEVASIDTVEDFWYLYTYIIPASYLTVGCDYSLFKKNIKPLWEDPANKNGGRWLITLPRDQHTDALAIWTDVELLLIGESFKHGDQVTGAVINVRPNNYKISVWTADSNDAEAILEIGNVLCDQLCLNPSRFQYKVHFDTNNASGTA